MFISRYFIFFLFFLASVAGNCANKTPKKYLVTIHEGRKIVVFKTDCQTAIDSLMVSYGLPRMADTIFKYSPFFEIRVDGVTIYAEKKIK